MKAYLLLSGLIFGAVSVAHAVRLFKGWDLIFGPYEVPFVISYAGIAVPAVLCIWALRMARKA